MGRKYEKDGKLYEEGVFGDREIGTLKDKVNIGGGAHGKYDYGRSTGGHDVEIDGDQSFSRDSTGTIDGESGVFKHNPFSREPDKRFFESDLENKVNDDKISTRDRSYRTSHDIDVRRAYWGGYGGSYSTYNADKPSKSPLQKLISFYRGVLLTGLIVTGAVGAFGYITTNVLKNLPSNLENRVLSEEDGLDDKVIEMESVVQNIQGSILYYRRLEDGTIVLSLKDVSQDTVQDMIKDKPKIRYRILDDGVIELIEEGL